VAPARRRGAREGEVEGQRHAVLAGQDLLQVPAHEQVEERAEDHGEKQAAHVELVVEEVVVEVAEGERFVCVDKGRLAKGWLFVAEEWSV